MIAAETVTFGGGGIDRAAGLRGDAARQADLLAGGRVLPLWRGRVMVAPDGAALGWVPAGHRVLAAARMPPLLLGLDPQGQGIFAQDISAWDPGALAVAAEPGFFDQSRQPHPDAPEGWALAELRAVMVALSPAEAELAATARGLIEWHRRHGFCANCGAGSTVSQAGWQRHCPACGADHFPRTDPVVIMLVERGNRLLLGRGNGWPERMFSCLAGFVEPGETVEAAVRREVFEETGVRCGQVRYLASQPWPFPASLMLGCRTEALTEEIRLDPAELAEARWVTREELVSVLADRHPDIRPPRPGAIAQVLIANWLADRLD
jgi:NAD+ diphosphatase